MASSKSYDAFTTVDKLVSKPVLGSDGAASWQEFRKETKECNRESVAPALQVKRADRLGTGLTTLADERANETRIRQESGEAALGSGYTTFKRKNEGEEARERKRKKRIEKKMRPEKKTYFMAAKSFDGWKFDYIFTTREERGTGYYWDGTDSVLQLHGKLVAPPSHEVKKDNKSTTKEEPKTEKKQQENDKSGEETKMSNQESLNPSSPRANIGDQVEEAIRRRNERLLRPPICSREVVSDWKSSIDTASGKTYYYNQTTGKRQWDPPSDDLPDGWKSTKDSTGKVYYYNNGQTSWERPK